MGGLVTSHHAGMSVPDWPNSYGYNMFLFPPNQWIGGVLYEHTHRLMATVVGFLSVILTLWAWGPSANENARKWMGWSAVVTAIGAVSLTIVVALVRIDYGSQAIARYTNWQLARLDCVWFCSCLFASRPAWRWVRWLCTSILGVVLLQGLLGGLRVVLVQLDLAIVHACLAQAFFCLAAACYLVTSPQWTLTPEISRLADAPRRLATLGIVAVSLVYLQLIVGADAAF